MVGVVVRRSHHIDKIEPFRRDDSFRNTDVLLAVPAYFRVRESERYGSSRRNRPFQSSR